MARSSAARDVKFPVGRIIGGSLYTAQTKDADGKPLVVKTGQNAGQPTQKFSFGVAYPKTPGKAHWAHEEWGAEIWAVGNTAFPKIAENPNFSYKVTNGDSTVVNKKGVSPVSREGYAGNWIVWFSSTYAPKIVNADGSAYILEPDAVMPGDYVEVHATVDGNASTQNPGVYINHNVVSFQGYSQLGRIHTSGVDPAAVGFGKSAKPAGLTMVPAAAPPHTAAPAASPAAAAPPYTPPAPPPAIPTAGTPIAAPAPAPTAVVPSPGFLAPPGAAPLPPPVVPPAPVRQMTAKAQGNTYEGLIGQGWTDALLVQHGLMVTA